MLATYSLLPIVRAFTKSSKVNIELRDISVAGRVLANFPWSTARTSISEAPEKARDHLAELGELSKTPAANIVKLPNVSASVPQLKACIAELRSQGFMVPDYPEDPKTEQETQTKSTYSKVLGSAVNPVLREGNSDRRVAAPVKEDAQRNPHKLKPWAAAAECKTEVAHMSADDFYGNEKSVAVASPTTVRIELVDGDDVTVLKPRTALQAGEVIDGSVMRVASLREFFEKEITDCKEKGLLLSLHLKATMMKVSDPIMFGHAVSVFFKDTFTKYAALFEELGVNPNNGLGDLYRKLESAPEATQAEVKASLEADYAKRPALAMVDSDAGITNLHVPSDVIIDASMPPMIRDGGKMWNAANELQETKALVPDRCYAGMYKAAVDDCRAHGAFDVATMGNVANVGLMAQKAEEYGSHDKTFEIPKAGRVRVVDAKSGETYFEHEVAKGDIWRMCQTKDSPIQDWVRLAVSRARESGSPAIFWLDKARAHDAVLIEKVQNYLTLHDTAGVDISILPPVEAMKATLARVRRGEDTISVTGNVLRDYLTDLFPILELGTSAKMLSIVPLLAGGGLYETGAGGSAPKHVQQLVKENHLRWDSLGEFLALAVSLDDLGRKTGGPRARVLADTLNIAIGRLLRNGKSPGRKVGQLDNRGSHFYLALYWAEALAEQTESARLAEEFTAIHNQLLAQEAAIVDELLAVGGQPVDLKGYYCPCPEATEQVMRPSKTFNAIIDSLAQANVQPHFMNESERRAFPR
jgi:isocitrate dehydrogenase